MKRSLGASPFALLLVVLALLASAAAAAEGPIEIDFSPDKVEFFPNTEWALAQLTVTGPECLYFQRIFRPGERIAFTPFDESGEPLPDGVFSWSVKLGPDAEVRGLEESYGEGQLCRGREELPPLEYLTSTGYISVLEARFVDPFIEEERGIAGAAANGGAESDGAGGTRLVVAGARLGGPASEGGAVRSMAAAATVLTNADGVIRNSLCVGFDCPNNPTFGDTTILLMENNTRIKFDDTSTISGFPNRDWEIEANSAQSGGLSYFGVNDCGGSSQGNCATDLVFLIEANAPQNSIRVDDGGRVGFGTGSPVTELHVVDGDTPTLRLEQDGSSGFAPQTWDVAGNETNFFVRDATGGSALPFRIQPGTASNTLFLDADDRVGIGTTSPTDKLHVRSTTGVASILVEEASGTLDNNRVLLEVVNNGRAQFRLRNTADTSGLSWFVSHETNGNFAISREGTGVAEVTVEPDGDMIITGNYTPDYVFDPGYQLMPLAELEEFITREKHLPNVPNAAEVEKHGINVNDFPMALLEKIEELTLHTIAQQKTIDTLQAEVAELKTARAD